MQRQASKAKKEKEKIKGTTRKWRRETVGKRSTRTESKRRSDRLSEIRGIECITRREKEKDRERRNWRRSKYHRRKQENGNSFDAKLFP